MKKLTIFAFAAVLALGATSCKKDWTCECTDSSGSASFKIYKTDKKTAKIGCALSQEEDVTCKLK